MNVRAGERGVVAEPPAGGASQPGGTMPPGATPPIEPPAAGRSGEAGPAVRLGALARGLSWPPALVLLAMLPLLVRRVGDPDYWWHLATAHWMVAHHALPSHDLFTYTSTATPWADHEWLSELLMAGLDRVGGMLAVSLFFGAVTWAGIWLLSARIRLRPHRPWVAAAALVVGVLAAAYVFGPRIQMLTFALVCLELYWLELFHTRGSRWINALPAVMVLWANLHGGFVIAFLFLGVAALAEALDWAVGRDGARRRTVHLLAITGATAVAAMVTPFGISGFTFAFATQFDPGQQSLIAEWQSPNFHVWWERGTEAAVLLLLAGMALQRLRLRDLLMAVAGVALALQAVRHSTLFAACAVPLLAWSWSGAADRLLGDHSSPALILSRRTRRAGAALLTASVAAASLAITGALLSRQTAATRSNFPVAAADWLAAHPATGTRMLNDYGWGGYLLSRFPTTPTRRVFIYGGADHIDESLVDEYEDIVALRADWHSLLARHHVDYVVFGPDTALSTALAADPAWHLAYSDAVANIFVRTAASSGG